MTVDVKSVLKSTQKSSSNLRPDKRKEWMGEVFYGNLGLVLSMWCILETFLDWRAAFRDVMVG